MLGQAALSVERIITMSIPIVMQVSNAFVAFEAGASAPGFCVTRLPGDASNRSYFRVRQESGSQSWMIMKLALEPFKSEEGQGAGTVRRLPFSEVSEYLSRGGIGVPAILAEEVDRGFLVLEDLGDVTVERALVAGGSKVELYQWAIDVLVDMQAWALSNPDPVNIAFNRRFDADLLLWEFEHFYEWGLVELTGTVPDEHDRAVLKAFFDTVTGRLCSIPQGFVHRDFQSRNLMIHDGRMRLIDFQDALVGPFIYDMVALLRDSYVKFTPVEVESFLQYYADVGAGVGLVLPPMEEMKKMFHMQALQRKLKDAGRFVFIDRVKGNPKFLSNIPRSLAYVREAFDNLPEFDEVRLVLAKYLPEHFGQ